MSGEDRADRLRRRRQRSRDRALSGDSEESDEPADSDESNDNETTETTAADETAKPDETGETDRTDESGESDGEDEPRLSVKDEQKPTYMYLPHAVRRDLDRAYSVLKAEYEYEYEEPFEKNRHFYPLVVSLGLEAVDELDAEDVRSRLEEK